jgi:RNA polymerase sigma factor (sigma-70 family)
VVRHPELATNLLIHKDLGKLFVKASDLNTLFDRAKSGDSGAESELFSYLLERFRYLAALRIWDPMDVEEVIQGAMLIICREYKTLEVTSSFAAWVHKVLDNRIHTYTRSVRGYKRRIDSDTDVVEAAPATTEDLDLRRRLIDCLRTICTANRQFARVLNFHSQGYQTEEVCERMRLPKNSYYSLLRRGRMMLSKCLESGKVK